MGESLFQDVADTVGEGATRLQTRTAIRTKAFERSARAELRAAQKAGVRLAKEGRVAKERIAKKEAADVKAINKRIVQRKGIKAEDLTINIEESIDSNLGVDAILKSIESDVLAQDGVTKDSPEFKRDLKETTYHALLKLARHMSWGKQREGDFTKMRKLRDMKTSIKDTRKLARQVLDSIRQHRIHKSSSKALEEIKGLLNSNLVKKAISARVMLKNRKIMPKHHRALKLARDAFKLTKPAMNSLIEKIESFTEITSEEGTFTEDSKFRKHLIESMPSLGNREYSNMSDYDIAMLATEALDTYGAIGQRSLPDIMNALSKIEDLLSEGKQGLYDEIQKRNAEIDPHKVGFFKAMRLLVNKGDANIVVDKISANAKEAYSMERRMSDFLIGMKDGAVKNSAKEAIAWLEGKWSEASTKARNDMIRGNEEFMFAVADAYGIEKPKKKGWIRDKVIYAKFAMSVNRKIDRLKTKRKSLSRIHPEGRNASIANLIQYIASWEQDDIRNDMKSEGWTQDRINEAMRQLSSEDLVMLDNMRNAYEIDGAELDAVSVKTTGVKVSNPSPVFMPVLKIGQKLWNPANASSTSVMPPTLKEREGGGSIDPDVDFIDIYMSRNIQHSHYKAYTELTQTFRRFFDDSKTLTAMTRKLGKTTVQDMLDHAADIVSSHAGRLTSPFWEQLRAAYGTKALGFNPKMLFTQPTSFWSYLWYVTPKDFTKAGFNWPIHPVQSWKTFQAIRKAPQYENRMRLGASETIGNAMSRNMTAVIDDTIDAVSRGKLSMPEGMRTVMRTIGDAVNLGFVHISAADFVPAFMMGPGMVTEMQNNHIRNGLSEEVALKQAIDDFYKLTEKTQQSNTPENQSKLQRRWGTIGRMIAAFKSFPQQIWSSTNDAAKKVIQGTKSERLEGAKVLFVNTVLLPATYQTAVFLFQSITGRLPENEEEETRYLKMASDFLFDPMDGWIGPGYIIESFLQGVWGDNHSRGGSKFIPAEGFLRDSRRAGELMAVAIEAIKGEEDLDAVIEEVIDLVKGTPGARVVLDPLTED
jgi:hypothetical protein